VDWWIGGGAEPWGPGGESGGGLAVAACFRLVLEILFIRAILLCGHCGEAQSVAARAQEKSNSVNVKGRTTEIFSAA
jgi:hypothetical protein